jgi:DNA polymerase elongation subunit (family B)
MPVHFHILDVFARDEKIVSENEEEVLVQYSSNSENSDDEEFQRGRKGYSGAGTPAQTFKGDHTGKSIVVHLFGKTAEGYNIRADVKGFKPFFYIRAPEGGPTTQTRAVNAVREYLRRHINPTAVFKSIEIEKCNRKELFGFTQNRAVPMIKLTMPSIAVFRDVKNCFCNGAWEPELKKLMGRDDLLGEPFPKGAPMVYEANLDPMLRFLHLRNLSPCNWATLTEVEPDELDTDGVSIVECEWTEIDPCKTPPAATAPFTIASWDIECMSTSGAFPMATKGDPIIQIGVILSSLGSTAPPEKHIFTLGTCDQIPEGRVYAFPDEKKLLTAWFRWLNEKDIDIFIGYNIFGFDEKYVWERCEQLGLATRDDRGNGMAILDELRQLNRLSEVGGEMSLETKRLSSSAMGDNFLYLWTTAGRLRVDLYHYIKRGYPLPSYKLDDTSRNFLGESVKKINEKVDAWELTIGSTTKQDVAKGRSVVLLNAGGDTLCEKLDVLEYEPGRLIVSLPVDVLADEVAKWAVVKDDLSPKEMFKMQGQGPSERAIIARYCVQDCQLVLDLFKKLDVFNNAMSMANVCSVPVGYIFLRGQGVKIESLMFKYCHESEQCIMVLPAARGDAETYEGAIVLDPKPGFYTTPVGVADFASLYPSTIISENISHDTLVWVKDYNDAGELIAFQWGSDAYDNVPGVRYTDIEYDNMIDDPEDMRKMKRKIKAGTRVCRYAQDVIGTIPKIVAGLLAARKAKRKEGEKETDPFRKALLDSEQLAYKLTANSLYGQLGSGTFKVRLKPLAASVTAYGRKQIMFAKAAIEDRYGANAGHPHCCATAETVYGDSVKGDTPIFIRKNKGNPEIVRMDELVKNNSWNIWHETKEAVELSNIEIWTEKGWTHVDRIIRHRLAPSKKMFRILTHTGVVDCTEDHSLVDKHGNELKPGDVGVGHELLHNDMFHKEFKTEECNISSEEAWAMGLFLADGSSDGYQVTGGIKYTWAINKANKELLEKASKYLPFETKILDTLESSGVYKLIPVGNLKDPALKYRSMFYNDAREKRVPSSILNAPTPIVESFMKGFYAGDGDKVGQLSGNYRWDQKGKEVCAGLAILAQRLGYSISVNDRATKPDVFRITCTKSYQRKNTIVIKKMYEIDTHDIEYVYDLQTENHHFAVGPGNLVVHNTDSLFINFNPRNPDTGKPLEGTEAVKKTIELTEEAGKFVSKMLKAPHDFEFDKVYWPFIIFSKKRYVGYKYEDADSHVLWFMGVALKRRDYAAIVKRIYSGALNILLNERDVPKAAKYVQDAAVELVDGKYGLQPLTISKSLRAEYADPSRIAHKALADRIAKRDPGNAPASGDRIPFVYVQAPTGQAAPELQGDRIETPSYIKEKGLKPDYMFYIDHQIANPVCQLFGIVVDQIPGFDSYKPRGGWKTDNPETLITQRETAAYELLFRPAIDRNNMGAKRAFAQMFGGSVESQPGEPPAKRAMRSAAAAPVRRVVKESTQSTLDSMFMATMQLGALKSAAKQKKEAEKSDKAAKKSDKK